MKEKLYTIPPVSYTHLRAHETDSYLVCRLLLEKKKNTQTTDNKLTLSTHTINYTLTESTSTPMH